MTTHVLCEHTCRVQAHAQRGEEQADLFPGPSLFQALYLGPSAGLSGKEGNPKTSIKVVYTQQQVRQGFHT